MDLAVEDTGSRAAKLTAEDKKTKEEAEQVIAAEDLRGKPVEQGKRTTANPKRKLQRSYAKARPATRNNWYTRDTRYQFGVSQVMQPQA